jgi:hypothetical protein
MCLAELEGRKESRGSYHGEYSTFAFGLEGCNDVSRFGTSAVSLRLSIISLSLEWIVAWVPVEVYEEAERVFEEGLVKERRRRERRRVWWLVGIGV